MPKFVSVIVPPDGGPAKIQDVSTAAINELRANAVPEGYNDPQHHLLPDYVDEADRATYTQYEGGR